MDLFERLMTCDKKLQKYIFQLDKYYSLLDITWNTQDDISLQFLIDYDRECSFLVGSSAEVGAICRTIRYVQR